MVSTNRSLAKLPPLTDDLQRTDWRSRRARRKKVRDNLEMDRTFPYLRDIRPALIFFVIPITMILVSIFLGVVIPKPLLYGIALVLGCFLVLRSYYNVDLILAVAILYFPFSRIYVIPLAPGLNGTNIILIILLMAGYFQSQREKISLLELIPGSKVIFLFALLSAYSAVTLTLITGGLDYFKSGVWQIYKAWIDQFVFYFSALSVIRSREAAKCTILYIAIGSLAVVFTTVPEMLDKMGSSSMEKMRVGGPHMQPNNFGGFVAYTVLPIMALFAVYMKNIRSWLLSPYILLSAKLLITSFSRAAYLAVAVSALLVGYFRGKAFVFSWILVALSLLLIFPGLIPDAVVSRLNSTQSSVSTTSQQLDKSSQTRFVLWEAAVEMTSESPILGKGFGAFPLLKQQYTDSYVLESDPHNMYLYVSSQMGLFALVLFLLILLNMFEMGRKLARSSNDKFIRAAGIGGAGMAVCMAVINLFGSRFINIDFTCYFLVYYVVLQVFFKEKLDKEELEKKNKKKKRHFPQPVSRQAGK